MPITSNQFQNVLLQCTKIWDVVLDTPNGGVINFLPDGTIYASAFAGQNYNITQTCCNILRDRLLVQNPPQYPTNVDPNNIYFDLDEQKCRWSRPSNESCAIPDKEIKIVLNPVGNDGAFFTLTENDTCRLEIKFDYLFKIKCKTLEEVINVTPVTNLKPATELRQEYFKKESELLDINIQLEGLSKEAASTPYSIICNDFPTNQEFATAKPTTEITQTQKLPFLNTGFGSLTNNTELSVSTTKVAPIYETKPVNFCLTDVGLLSWRNIIGENNYVDFINGQPDSYTCLDVIEIDKLNQEAIITNNKRLIFECTTPFGEKTTLLNKISELITIQKTLNNKINTIDAKIKALGDVVNPCSTMLGQFENLNARVTLDMVDGDNVTMENIFFSTFFDVGQNLYSYLNSNQNNSGFFVCGEPTNNEPWASGCTGLVYPEFTFGDTVEDSSELNVSICNNVKDILYQELFNSSGAQTQQDFNDSLSPNVFNSNWLTYTNTINTTSGFTNNQIKLNIIVNSSCDNFCLLIDQISLTKVCEDTNRTNIFISQSPGFEITRIIDNKKSWLQSDSYTERDFYIARYDDVNKIRQTEYSVDDDRLILNSKEIDLTVNMASAVENDVWCYLLDNPNLLTGSTNPSPCTPSCGDNMFNISGLTTTQISDANTLETFEDTLVSQLTDVKNRKILSTYPTLRALYDRYMNAAQFGVIDSNEFDYLKMDKFTGLIKTYWDDLIEQVVPATTLWGSVKVYTNTMFDQQKFKYRSYTSLFCDEPKNRFRPPFIPPSPINGNDGLCQKAEVVTTNLEVFPSNLQFRRRQFSYNKICLSQMNYGSEFIGNVDITGPDGQDINSDGFCGPCIPEFIYNGENFTNLELSNGASFKSDGTILYISTHNGSPLDNISAYSLSTPWDVSTINPTKIGNSIGFPLGNPSTVIGQYFSPDGKNVFFANYSRNGVFKYSLSTAWNISTSSYSSGDVFSGGTLISPAFLEFSPNGLFMFVNVSGGLLKRYTLTTAWDISSGVVESQSISFGNSFDFTFQNDGYYLFSMVLISGVLNIRKQVLSIPYDLTSIISTETKILTSFIPAGNLYTITFKDGYKGFISGYYPTPLPSRTKVYAFELGCEWDITPPIVINSI